MCRIALLLLLVCHVRGARILVVAPTPSYSHQIVFHALTQQLARRGHRLVMLTTDPTPPHPNITQIDLHDSYALWIQRFVASTSNNDMFSLVEISYDIIADIFEKQCGTPEVAKLLNDPSQRFDLVLVEAWIRPTLAFGHRFRAPVIQMTSLPALNEQYDTIMGSFYSFLYADLLRSRVYNLSLWEEAKEIYNRFQLHRLIESLKKKEEATSRRVFGAGTPPLSELERDIELLFVNVDPLWDNLRPTPPGVVHLGGLHMPPAKELPQELKAWMDASARGVVYVSFGTNVDPALIPVERMMVLKRVLGALPYDVLWRNAPAPLPANVRADAWLPQADLLRHEKLVLFVTQAGLQSTDEALRASVPLLALPIMVDQAFNAEQIQHYGVGRRLDLATLTDAQLNETIHTLINDKSYRKNSRLLGQAMRDRPQSSLQRAVWWTERVLRRRGPRRSGAAAPRLGQLAGAAAALAAGVLVTLYCICMMVFKGARKIKTS